MKGIFDMDELAGITSALKELLREKTDSTQTTFDLWFGELNITSLTEDTVVISTPTKLRKNILSTRFKKILEECIFEIIGFEVNIKIFSLDENKKVEEKEEIKEEPKKEIKVEDSEEIKKKEKEKEIIEVLKDKTPKKSILDEYTFENFVEGESNKFAKTVCYAAAKYPGEQNPLFIHGHSGLGKTHLLYAIMHYMKKNHPGLKIIYRTCESFMNELIEAIGNHNTTHFKEKYRSADVLLIDDIQFISGKESTQEEFFHTFSALYESEKQIIMTSDRPPKEINPLTERLRTRFEGSVIVEVLPPSFEIRTAIINKKADSLGLVIDNNLVNYMAERLNNNIRQIEGVIKKIYALYSLYEKEVTRELIEQVISIVDPGNIPNDILIERILSAVSKKHGVSVEDIKSKKKTDSIANARHMTIYIIKKLTDLSLKDIGQIFKRDHSTVHSSISKMETYIKTKNNYERDLNELIKEIKGV